MAEMVVRRGFGLQVDSNAIAHAEGVIVSSQDTEFAALTGISLALFDAKASNEGVDFVRKVGLRILHALPSKMVDPTLNHLVESIEEPWSRDKVLEVRSRLLIMKGSNLPSDRTR